MGTSSPAPACRGRHFPTGRRKTCTPCWCIYGMFRRFATRPRNPSSRTASPRRARSRKTTPGGITEPAKPNRCDRRASMRTLLLVVAVAACSAAPGAAQEITGTITGVVKDQSGAVIPGATVTVRNVATNIESAVVTDSTGVYVATALPVGRYEVKVELSGFRSYVRQDLEVHIADRLRVDPVLQTGTVSE